MDCSTFVVRVYRREGDSPSRLVGVVESADNGDPIPFRSPEDLWRALCTVGGKRVAQHTVPDDPGTKGERT